LISFGCKLDVLVCSNDLRGQKVNPVPEIVLDVDIGKLDMAVSKVFVILV
jgi:hypothetical protein